MSGFGDSLEGCRHIVILMVMINHGGKGSWLQIEKEKAKLRGKDREPKHYSIYKNLEKIKNILELLNNQNEPQKTKIKRIKSKY